MVVNEAALKHFFSSSKKKYSKTELYKHFDVHGEEEYQAFNSAFAKLEEDAFIYETKKGYLCLENNDFLFGGAISISRSGTGYIKVNKNDIIVPKASLNGALNGDNVIVRVNGVQKDGRDNGVVQQITKRAPGMIAFNYENGTFIPYKVPFSGTIKLSKVDMRKIDNNMRIAVRVDKNAKNSVFDAELVSIIGHKDDVGIDEMTIALENSFPIEFSDAVLKECEFMPTTVSESDITNRLDLRKKLIFTIDCAKTKDMDDAISIEINERNNFVLGVHIAHVSYYVKEGSAIFAAAKDRGTSVYMENTSLPMLPRKLSNGICSLEEGADRLTRSFFIEINLDGEIVDYSIQKSVINSKKKMNYDDVNKILEESIIPEGYEPFKDSLILMHKLSKILSLKKNKRGYLPFYSADSEVVFDELNIPIAFKENVARSAEELIENFMLLANEVTATHFHNMNYPTIYRVHEAPNKLKILELMKYISGLGNSIKNFETIDIKTLLKEYKLLAKTLYDLKSLEQFPIISDILLKCMQKAGYSTDNIGHYGLALLFYLHATSPIRRFPDLEVSMCLDKIDDCIFDYQTISKLEKNLEELAIYSSIKERDADNAEAEALAMHMAEYMENHIGEFFNGTIIDIGSFGVLIKTENNIIGRATFGDVLGDYYIYDDTSHSLIGKKTNNCYHIGDNVRIVVKSASKEFRTIDYKLIEKVKGEKRKEFQKTLF